LELGWFEYLCKYWNFSVFLVKHFRSKIFVYDGILIVKAKQTEINSLYENANRQHDLLKFTYECNNHSTKFLDLEIYKGKRFEKNKYFRSEMLY
jgi:hypothetical protein